MSESFGAWLRRERERRHIDLASIAANTKVRASLFEGLERDDVSRWPSGIFRRSFIRAYATAIGLDAEAIAREFQQRFPDPAEPASPAPMSGTGGTGGVGTEPETVLRLTLAETSVPFSGGRVLTHLRQRGAAVGWDAGVVVAIAVTLFVVLGEFWSSLGISMLCYYAGGILILGNTPGVCLFAPKPSEDEGTAPPACVPQTVPSAEPSLPRPSTVYPFKAVRRAR
jgi:transcriptional regulator with XRE-family HTH domain